MLSVKNEDFQHYLICGNSSMNAMLFCREAFKYENPATEVLNRDCCDCCGCSVSASKCMCPITAVMAAAYIFFVLGLRTSPEIYQHCKFWPKCTSDMFYGYLSSLVHDENKDNKNINIIL